MKKDFCDICEKEVTPREFVLDLNITDKEGFVIGFTSDSFYHTDIDICEECAEKLGITNVDDRVSKIREAVVSGLKKVLE